MHQMPGSKPDNISPYCLDATPVGQVVCALALAQQAKNEVEVGLLAQRWLELLGTKAGVPERTEVFVPVNQLSVPPEGLLAAFEAGLQQLEANQWWRLKPHPQDLPVPLRFFASLIVGAVAAIRAGATFPERLLNLATSVADYLLWSQEQAGNGVFGFPDVRGKKAHLVHLVERHLQRAEELGKLKEVLNNGWIIDDLGGGDLQFDNGLCGAAMLDLHQATGHERYLTAAIAAADWSCTQPAVPNWNYNSFSVFLLAKMFRFTGEPRYLEIAKEKARLGIYLGQLKTGQFAGRWMDAHNACQVYHYILVRGLGELLAALPPDDPQWAVTRQVLILALDARNYEIIERGVLEAESEIALEGLCRLELLTGNIANLPDAGRRHALDISGRHLVSLIPYKKLELEFAAWGLYLEVLATRQDR